MRPEVQRLIDIARSQKWQRYYNGNSEQVISLYRESYPSIGPFGIQMDSDSFLPFASEEESKAAADLSREVKQRIESEKNERAFRALVEFINSFK